MRKSTPKKPVSLDEDKELHTVERTSEGYFTHRVYRYDGVSGSLTLESESTGSVFESAFFDLRRCIIRKLRRDEI